MNFQRIMLALVILLAAGLAGSFYMNWKTLGQLRTVKAFVEGQVLADAVAACEKAQSTTPFKWTGGKQTAVDRPEFGQAQQGYHHPELHAGRRQRLLRLRSRSRRRPTSARTSWSGNRFSLDTRLVSSQMASEEAARIIDLYQRKAQEWVESRARASLFEKPWLDRFRALLPPAGPILDIGCGSAEPMARLSDRAWLSRRRRGFIPGHDRRLPKAFSERRNGSSPICASLPCAEVFRHPCVG